MDTLVTSTNEILALASLGVMFLLFELGLHFPLTQIRERAADIFGFGPVQVLFGAIGLGLIAFLLGVSATGALTLGATLALSSTAVVARLIADRHQENCPVGQTATAILIFQDVAGILLLVVVNASAGGAALLPAIGVALGKAAVAFGATVALSRVAVRPLVDLAARTGADEIFTAAALFFALGAGWVGGQIGLSITLGAFLGGVALADTPYRHTVAAEIKPFRGLLLGFFFISVGASLDLATLVRAWPWVFLATIGLFAVKAASNVASSLIFRWSIPGSIQLGFLIAQGSEFAFVLLTAPSMKTRIGADRSAVVIASVALSLALTPAVASAGRQLAGNLRRRYMRANDPELMPMLTAPVLVVGMGRRGRTVADALNHFAIPYAAVERNPRQLKNAVADGYPAVFSDMADTRLWNAIAARDRKLSVLTGSRYEDVEPLGHYTRTTYPGLRRIAAVSNADESARFLTLGVEPVVDAAAMPGLDLAAFVLREMGIEEAHIAAWLQEKCARASQTRASKPVGSSLAAG